MSIHEQKRARSHHLPRLDPPVSQDRIALILDKSVEVIKRTLAAGEPVKWSGFGSFVVKDIPPRRFYSPKRQEYATSSAIRRIVFVESGKRK